jgi:hypothetical protein
MTWWLVRTQHKQHQLSQCLQTEEISLYQHCVDMLSELNCLNLILCTVVSNAYIIFWHGAFLRIRKKNLMEIAWNKVWSYSWGFHKYPIPKIKTIGTFRRLDAVTNLWSGMYRMKNSFSILREFLWKRFMIFCFLIRI